MRRSRTAVVLGCALSVLLASQAGAAVKQQVAASPRPVVVAVLDSGLRATHQEFDYRGPSSSSDQVVAWWDFTTEVKGEEALPGDGERWDPSVREPYDKHGHGTLTASMVAGRTADGRKTPAAAPGAQLAIAKVANGDGSIEGNLAAAVRWAAETVRADVINISIGSIVPIPADLARPTYDAIAKARAGGALVVVANGNGYANAGVPGDPGWASLYSSSTKVLAVGAAGTNGYLVSTDPEVAAVYTVTGPSHQGDRDYTRSSGTSFGAPFVAGFAAELLRTARAAGRQLTPDQLELLVKHSALDTSVPPTFEGYGVVSIEGLGAAKEHARNGTSPTRPSPDVSGIYVESVAGTLRTAWRG